MSRAGEPRAAARAAAPSLAAGGLLLLVGFLAAPVAGSTPSLCSFTAGLAAVPTSGTTPLVVHFNASVSAGTPTGYNWSFGDGSYWNTSSVGAATPLHRYAAAGLFLARVVVVEGTCSSSATVTVGAVAGPITVVLRDEPAQGTAPLTVTFNATVAGGSGTYTSATWKFGDGGVGSGLNVEYTYGRAGTYTAELNVTDSAGHWGVAWTNLSVGEAGGGPRPGLSALTAAYLTTAALAAGLVTFLAYRRFRAMPAGTAAPLAPAAPEPAVDRSDRPEPTPPPRTEAPPEVGGETTPTLPGNTPAPVPPPGDRLQLTQRVLLHIGAQGVLGPDDVAPYSLTQGGMVEQLRASQNTVTNVLRRLVAAGVLSQEVRHVRGRPRRLRVYRFTGRGESIYRELRRSLAERANSHRRSASAGAPASPGPDGPSRAPR